MFKFFLVVPEQAGHACIPPSPPGDCPLGIRASVRASCKPHPPPHPNPQPQWHSALLSKGTAAPMLPSPQDDQDSKTSSSLQAPSLGLRAIKHPPTAPEAGLLPLPISYWGKLNLGWGLEGESLVATPSEGWGSRNQSQAHNPVSQGV